MQLSSSFPQLLSQQLVMNIEKVLSVNFDSIMSSLIVPCDPETTFEELSNSLLRISQILHLELYHKSNYLFQTTWLTPITNYRPWFYFITTSEILTAFYSRFYFRFANHSTFICYISLIRPELHSVSTL